MPRGCQSCHPAASLAGVCLVAQSKAAPSEYREEAVREPEHISAVPQLVPGLLPSPTEQNSPLGADGAWTSSLLSGGQLGAGHCLPASLSRAGAPSVSIFLKPPGVISPGGSTTICCSCQCANGHFVLYKNGHRLRALELPGSRAEFTLSNASWGDAGVYSCQYLAGGILQALSEGLDVMVQGKGCAPWHGGRCQRGRAG